MKKEIEKPILDSMPKEGIFAFMKMDFFDAQFVTKDTGLSSRLINHWRSLGILIEGERVFDQNYKFNFIEFLWIRAIIEIRELGLPMEELKKAKEILNEKHPISWYLTSETDENSTAKQKVEDYIYENFIDPKVLRENFVLSPSDFSYLENQFQYSLFELALFSFISKRNKSYIHILSNGMAVCDFGGRTNANQKIKEQMGRRPHIILPIFSLLNDFIEKDENFEFALKTEIFDPMEGQILQYVRSGNFDSITIEFKEGSPVFLEGKKSFKVDEAARIKEYILGREYSNINISVANGNIQYATKTTRVRLCGI